MNRGPDVKTESEVLSNLQRQMGELRREYESLKKEREPELLQELQSHFYDKPDILNEKELQKVQEPEGRNFVLMLQRYNSIIKRVIETAKEVPIGLYVITPEHKIVPIRLTVNFDERKLSLWKAKLNYVTSRSASTLLSTGRGSCYV